MSTITNPEFQTHRLNQLGIAKVESVKSLFNDLLDKLTTEMCWTEVGGYIAVRGLNQPSLGEAADGETVTESQSSRIPQGRYLSIVKTKLEEACMFAVKAVSCDPANQQE